MQTFKFLAAALVVVGVSATAQANVITQTGTLAEQKTDFTGAAFTVTGGLNSTTFADFNTALGTLTQVTMSYQGNGMETGTLTNSAPNTQVFQFSSFSNFYFQGNSTTPAVLSASAQFQEFGGALQLQEAPLTYTLAGGATTSILPTPNAFGAGVVTSSAVYTGSDAAEFEGNAAGFAINGNTESSSTFTGGGGNLASLLNTDVGGSITITYTYTPFTTVPEPASFALLGAGLMGLTFMARRRRSI